MRGTNNRLRVVVLAVDYENVFTGGPEAVFLEEALPADSGELRNGFKD